MQNRTNWLHEKQKVGLVYSADVSAGTKYISTLNGDFVQWWAFLHSLPQNWLYGVQSFETSSRRGYLRLQAEQHQHHGHILTTKIYRNVCLVLSGELCSSCRILAKFDSCNMTNGQLTHLSKTDQWVGRQAVAWPCLIMFATCGLAI